MFVNKIYWVIIFEFATMSMGKCVKSLLSVDLSLFCVAVTECHRPDHIQRLEFSTSFWKLRSPRSRNLFARSLSYATTCQRALHGWERERNYDFIENLFTRNLTHFCNSSWSLHSPVMVTWPLGRQYLWTLLH